MWTTRPHGIERALAFDEATGKVLWTRMGSRHTSMQFETGPKATRPWTAIAYFLGAAGQLMALNSKTGEVLWKKNYITDYNAQIEHWPGTTESAARPWSTATSCYARSAAPDSKVVAFDKRRQELWRAVR